MTTIKRPLLGAHLPGASSGRRRPFAFRGRAVRRPALGKSVWEELVCSEPKHNPLSSTAASRRGSLVAARTESFRIFRISAARPNTDRGFPRFAVAVAPFEPLSQKIRRPASSTSGLSGIGSSASCRSIRAFTRSAQRSQLHSRRRCGRYASSISPITACIPLITLRKAVAVNGGEGRSARFCPVRSPVVSLKSQSGLAGLVRLRCAFQRCSHWQVRSPFRASVSQHRKLAQSPCSSHAGVKCMSGRLSKPESKVAVEIA